MKKQFALYLCCSLLLGGCQPKKSNETSAPFESIAQNERQWTGVAVSKEQRVFVNFPYWSDDVPVSVAELINGTAQAYPNMDWNMRNGYPSFNAVQSVVVDDLDRLWVLDTNNPRFQGVTGEGPRLYQFNLSTNELEADYSFPSTVYSPESYFNDVRIDTRDHYAYLTDSGDGAIIVLNLETGKARRVLDNHPSTHSETDHLICDGIRWENSVHADGIALTPQRDFLYYIALSGHTLYRIPTTALKDSTLSEDLLTGYVEKVKEIPATDGMLFDSDGNLYLGGLETNAINRLNADGALETILQDDQIRWADSFAKDAQGSIYFTTSQIHLPNAQRQAYEVIRFQP